MAWTTILTFEGANNVMLDFTLYKYRVFNYSGVSKSLRVNSNAAVTINSASFYELKLGVSGLKNGENMLHNTSSDFLTLEREPLNTAPTQPGAFTQPTGELEIGDTRTISWVNSTDVGDDFERYILETSINNGTWNVVGETTWYPTTTYTIPTATTIKFRVKARDTAGLESPYRESPTYTVTKPKYYWSKYNVVSNWEEPVPVLVGNSTGGFAGLYKTLTWNSTSKSFNYPNGVTWKSDEVVPVGGVAWIFSYNNPIRYTATESKIAGSNINYNSHDFNSANSIESFSKGTLIQSGIVAIEGTYPTDGKHTDGFWYVRGSRVNQSIAPTGAFTAPTPATVLKPSQGVAVTFTASTAANISLYELEYRYNSGLWTTLGTNNTALTRSFTPTTDKTLTNVQFRVRAKNTSNVYSDYVYSEFYNIEHNAKPTITLTTGNNLALSENANLAISGQAVDADNGNVLTVYYQINTGNTTALATGISNGTAPLPYTKTLQFKQGALYDGTTIVFNNMVGEQTYTLKVWAEDNQGGKSDVQSRLFTVIPNRAPVLTVTAIEPASDKINNDTMTIAGTVTDPENQTITVKYKINNGELIQVYSGAGGNYTFNFKLGALNVGDNIIEIQAADSYNLITTVKKRITKRADMINLLKSVARYKGTLPTAGVTGVVAWFERETGDLTINPTVSMRTTGQTESYEDMTLSNTAPINAEITEDQYQKSVETAKTELVLKVSLEKTVAASTKGIKKITGALQ